MVKLDQIVSVYENLEKVLDSLPEQIPSPIKTKIRDAILNDKELKEIVDNIKNRRAPRYLLIGNTGHGKSSLINAMVGYYAAHVSSVQIGTKETERYDILDEEGNVAFSVLDSRGINESFPDEKKEKAEDQLTEEMSNFTPDAVLYIHKAKERASMGKEIEFLKNVSIRYEKMNHQKLPILTVLTQCDELDPASKKEPSLYNERKLQNIKTTKEEVEKIIASYGLEVKCVIVTSSLMEYEQSYEDLNRMTISQKRTIKPETDGRYQIEELKEILIDSIEDVYAQMGSIAEFRVAKVLKSLARKFTHIFTGIAGVVAATPIPVSDVFILCAIEAVLVMIIAALSGREVSFKTAGELVVSFGGVGALGFGARVAAQQLSKFVNAFFPGAGSAVSASIAVAGMETTGNLAIKYYFS